MSHPGAGHLTADVQADRLLGMISALRDEYKDAPQDVTRKHWLNTLKVFEILTRKVVEIDDPAVREILNECIVRAMRSQLPVPREADTFKRRRQEGTFD